MRRCLTVLLDTYRRTGADLPFGDPRRPHGVAMEGWFWRITAPATGVVAVVLAAGNPDAGGRAGGARGPAAPPGGLSRAPLGGGGGPRPECPRGAAAHRGGA